MPSALGVNSATDYYYNTTTPPSGNLTMALWAKIATDRNTFSTPIAIDASDTNCAMISTNSDGTTMIVYTNGANNPSTGFACTVGTWYKFAYVRNGTVGTFYGAAATAALTSITGTCATITPTTVDIGACRRTAAAEFFNGSIAAVKIWTAALTLAELVGEFAQYAPMRSANLQRYYSFANGPQTNDESGNGFTLTAGAGSLVTDTAGPPIPVNLAPRYPRTVSFAMKRAANW